MKKNEIYRMIGNICGLTSFLLGLLGVVHVIILNINNALMEFSHIVISIIVTQYTLIAFQSVSYHYSSEGK